MDLIDRQAAIDALKRAETLTRAFGYHNVIDTIRELPSAQPEPKTVRWVNANEGKWNTVEVLKCTACGELDNRMYRTDRYCPNCGAKMGGDA